MKLKKFIFIFIPYVFVTNIVFSYFLRDPKINMKTWTTLYVITINIPLLAGICYFGYCKITGRGKLQ